MVVLEGNEMKKCYKCNEMKPSSAFTKPKEKNKRWASDTWCKACKDKKARESKDER